MRLRDWRTEADDTPSSLATWSVAIPSMTHRQKGVTSELSRAQANHIQTSMPNASLHRINLWPKVASVNKVLCPRDSSSPQVSWILHQRKDSLDCR